MNNTCMYVRNGNNNPFTKVSWNKLQYSKNNKQKTYHTC